MEQLFILGSSFLLPNNKEWRSNIKHNNLQFGEYGDWGALINTRSEEQDTLAVFFLDDIFYNMIIVQF